MVLPQSSASIDHEVPDLGMGRSDSGRISHATATWNTSLCLLHPFPGSAADPVTRSRAAQGMLDEPERGPGGSNIDVLQSRCLQNVGFALDSARVQGAQDIHHAGGARSAEWIGRREKSRDRCDPTRLQFHGRHRFYVGLHDSLHFPRFRVSSVNQTGAMASVSRAVQGRSLYSTPHLKVS